MKSKPSLRHFLLLAGSICFAASSLRAQSSGTWNVDAGGDWSDTGNWLGGTVADGSGFTATFTMTGAGSGNPSQRIINVDGARTIGNITRNWANNSLLTISGSAITLAGTNPTITNNDSSSTARRIVISSQILGIDGLNIAGGGMVQLGSGTTNYTGATSITGNSFLDFGTISNANIGGGSGRNITVEAGSAVRFNGLNNDYLNRIAQTNDVIYVITGPVGVGTPNSNALDFSSTGANLPNAFLGSWSSNNAPTRYYGTITPASDNYRLGSPVNPAAQSFQVGSLLSGSQGLIIGGGTVVLSNSDNTFSGDTVVQAGRLALGKLEALKNSALNTDTGSLTFLSDAGGNLPDRELVDAPVLGGLIGSQNLADMYNTGTLNNVGQVTAANVLGITLNPGTGKSHTYSGDVALNSSMFLTKTGDGTQIFAGTNTHGGATTIYGGTLALGAAGSIDDTSGVILGGGTFDVSAKTGGYAVENLSGNGSVVGSLTVSTQLSIGSSPGTIDFDSLTLGSSATYLYELAGGDTAADLGNISGTLDLGGAILDLVQLGTFTVGDKFTLFAYDFGNLSGTFNGLADGDTFSGAGGLWQIDYDDSLAGVNGGTGDTFVTITAIPEPRAALLGAFGLLLLFRRRR